MRKNEEERFIFRALGGNSGLVLKIRHILLVLCAIVVTKIWQVDAYCRTPVRLSLFRRPNEYDAQLGLRVSSRYKVYQNSIYAFK